MGIIDNYTKKYMSNNEVFADAFNFYLYDGDQVIKADDLRSVDTTAVATLDNVQINASVQKIRDNYKILAAKKDNSMVYVVLGVENESEINFAEPVKNMVYDALEYAKQVAETAKKHKANNETKKITSGEFIRGFHKNDKLVPVITLVIFFNPEKWNAPKSIHEMFDIDVKDKRILPYIGEYKINLISPYDLSDNDASKLHSNLKEVLLYIKNSNDKKKLRELVNNDENFSKLDRDAACVINACTNSKMKINENEGVVNMCKAIQDMVSDGFNDGINAGINIGINTGKILGAINMCKSFGATFEETISKITSTFKISADDVEKIVKENW